MVIDLLPTKDIVVVGATQFAVKFTREKKDKSYPNYLFF